MNLTRSAVCTLFEGVYHNGVGVLANSLYAHGFRGTIYAGYRGELPPWATPLCSQTPAAQEFCPREGLRISFVRLTTKEHLTNIKPDFMQEVWRDHAPEADYLAYFDPDIVVKTQWTNFQQWMDHGVALCEDMNSPVGMRHPLRLSWAAYFQPYGIDYQPQDNLYVNGGYVGVHRRDRTFLQQWYDVQTAMKDHIGTPQQIGIADRWDPFHLTDQDALNVTKDLYHRVSIMEKHSMDFARVGSVMSHAAGKKKPWNKNHLREILVNSTAPANTDKLYWQHAIFPIPVYSAGMVRRKAAAIRAASLLGRIVKRV